MSKKNRPIFVVDTNILIDYPGVIQTDGSFMMPDEATIDLRGAHIVIPTAVIRELSNFKHERSERGRVARKIHDTIRSLPGSKRETMRRAYNLEAPIETAGGEQLISILPIHANFKRILPFQPSEDDMDGQIVLTTLAVMFLEKHYPIDGTAIEHEAFLDLASDNVTLLTNDNGLAIRAKCRGIHTSRFSYKYSEPYNGRRDIVVPKELFEKFFNEREIKRDFFEKMMPKERTLVANEFVMMRLGNLEDYPKDFDPSHNPYFLHIGRYDKDEDAILPLRYVSDFPIPIMNDGQATYAEALMNPKFDVVICTGPAGTGKTFLPSIYGYETCRGGSYIETTLVPCKSQSELGALPGDVDEKMALDIRPVKRALENYLLKYDPKFKKELENMRKFGATKKTCSRGDESEGDNNKRASLKQRLSDRVDLIWKNWFSCLPVETAQGENFNNTFVIYDEFQDQSVKYADTLLKRLGDNGKMVIAGDLEQLRAPYLDLVNNGIVYAMQMYYDVPRVAIVRLSEDEVVRHPLVELLAQKQKKIRLPSGANQ